MLAGCRWTRRRTDRWKTEPDLYQIECNVPYAKVEVYSSGGTLLSTQNAGESFARLDSNSTVKVSADGYYTYDGPVDQLEVVGKKSWFVTLRKKAPGDQGG
jgi:hypothetical protein